MAKGTCQYCNRPTAGDICPAHGYVGAPAKPAGSPFFRGLIADFYGTVAQIPPRWQVCDGTNGTPDLRDRVTVGAGTSWTLGQTAGSNADHTHSVPGLAFSGSGTSGAGSSHSHSGGAVGQGAAVYTDTVGNHSHGVYSGSTDVASADTHTFLAGTVAGDHTYTQTTHYHGMGHQHAADGSHSHLLAAHNHSFTGAAAEAAHTHTSNASGTTSGGTSGGASIGTNMPAFYALAFIMRI
jgi:hypothetical protein